MAKSDMAIKVDWTEWISKEEKLRFAMDTKRQSAIGMILETNGLKMESLAREERPWTDRTGDARRRLKGGLLIGKNELSAYVGHGVSYGIYLELDHQRRYAILEHARSYFVKETLFQVKDYIKKVR